MKRSFFVFIAVLFVMTAVVLTGCATSGGTSAPAASTPAAAAPAKQPGVIGPITLAMKDNFQYGICYEATIADANVTAGHQIKTGDVITIKYSVSASRDLERGILFRFADSSEAASWWRDLTEWDDDDPPPDHIPALKAGEVHSGTVTLTAVANSTGTSGQKNTLVIDSPGEGVKGRPGSGVQKAFELVFTELVITIN